MSEVLFAIAARAAMPVHLRLAKENLERSAQAVARAHMLAGRDVDAARAALSDANNSIEDALVQIRMAEKVQ